MRCQGAMRRQGMCRHNASSGGLGSSPMCRHNASSASAPNVRPKLRVPCIERTAPAESHTRKYQNTSELKHHTKEHAKEIQRTHHIDPYRYCETKTFHSSYFLVASRSKVSATAICIVPFDFTRMPLRCGMYACLKRILKIFTTQILTHSSHGHVPGSARKFHGSSMQVPGSPWKFQEV